MQLCYGLVHKYLLQVCIREKHRHEEARIRQAFPDVGYGDLAPRTFQHSCWIVQVQCHHFYFCSVRWLLRGLPQRSPLGLTYSFPPSLAPSSAESSLEEAIIKSFLIHSNLQPSCVRLSLVIVGVETKFLLMVHPTDVHIKIAF